MTAKEHDINSKALLCPTYTDIHILLVCLLLANTILDVLIWLIHTGGLTGRLKIFLRVFSRTYERQNISTEPQKMALNAVLI